MGRFRCLAFHHADRTVELQSRQGRAMTRQFPDIARLVRDHTSAGVVLDGELIIWAQGRLNFALLQRRNAAGAHRILDAVAEFPAHYVVFDALQVPPGLDVRARPLIERRALLEQLLAGVPPQLPLSPQTTSVEQAHEWLETWPAVGVEGLLWPAFSADRLTAICRGRGASFLDGGVRTRREVMWCDSRVAAVVVAREIRMVHRLADEADAISTRHLRGGGPVPSGAKADGSLVTEADREVEIRLRSLIAKLRPSDAFVGEEFGAHGVGRRRWLIDGIDGTASFVAGRPEWGTLIAAQDGDTVELGMVSAPALGRRWWAARDGGAWTASRRDGRTGDTVRLAVSERVRLSEAVVAVWPMPDRLLGRQREAALSLMACSPHVLPDPAGRAGKSSPVKPSTGSGTCHGGLLVATRQVDVSFSSVAGRGITLRWSRSSKKQAGGSVIWLADGGSIPAPRCSLTAASTTLLSRSPGRLADRTRPGRYDHC